MSSSTALEEGQEDIEYFRDTLAFLEPVLKEAQDKMAVYVSAAHASHLTPGPRRGESGVRSPQACGRHDQGEFAGQNMPKS